MGQSFSSFPHVVTIHHPPPSLSPPSLTIPDYVVLHLMSHASITLAKLSRILFFVCFVYSEINLASWKKIPLYLLTYTCVTCICSLLIAGLVNNLQSTHISHRGSVNPSEQSEHIVNMSLVNTSHRSRVQLAHYHDDGEQYCNQLNQFNNGVQRSFVLPFPP